MTNIRCDYKYKRVSKARMCVCGGSVSNGEECTYSCLRPCLCILPCYRCVCLVTGVCAGRCFRCGSMFQCLCLSLCLCPCLCIFPCNRCVCAVTSVMVYVGGGASDVEACISTRWKHVSEVFASLPLTTQPWDQRTHSLLKVLNSESVAHILGERFSSD